MGEPRVVADTSALILYARSGQLALLADLFGSVLVPTAVRDEVLRDARTRPGGAAVGAALDAGWLKVATAPGPRLAALRRKHPNLGEGELAALALAGARGHDIVLVDDTLARAAARLEGLRPVGSLGILVLAHRRGLLKTPRAVEDALRRLLQAGLWVGADVVEEFWHALGGRA